MQNQKFIVIGGVTFERIDVDNAGPTFEAHVYSASSYRAPCLGTPGQRRRAQEMREAAEGKLRAKVPGAMVIAWTADL